jgi:competence protein CoiA
MSGTARTKAGEAVAACRFEPAEWESLKASYTLGDFLTTCCDSPAVPKTSQNGLPFFAHNSDECSTAPETVWHKTAKALICSYLGRSGLRAVEEYASADRKWIADVYFEIPGRKVAIELQHSYQGLPKYLERHRRYHGAGLECYWLLYPQRFETLSSSVGKWRIRNEFGGKLPTESLYACTSELPFLGLEIEPSPRVRGAKFFNPSLEEWLASILKGSFAWDGSVWVIR